MKIFGQAAITGNGLVMSGYYAYAVSGNRKPKLLELSSPTYTIEHFDPPYDAILKSKGLTGDNLIAVGRKLKSSSDTISSNRSGAFYFFDSATLVGTCHGLGRDDLTFYSGHNFYNAFYPVGYFQPPFGETLSLYKLNTDEFDNLPQGACFQMSVCPRTAMECAMAKFIIVSAS